MKEIFTEQHNDVVQEKLKTDFIEKTVYKKNLIKHIEMLMTIKNNEMECYIEQFKAYNNRKNKEFAVADKFNRFFKSAGLGALTVGSAIGLVASGAPLEVSLLAPIGTYTAIGISSSMVSNKYSKDSEYRRTISKYRREIDTLDNELFLYYNLIEYLHLGKGALREHIRMYLEDENVTPLFYYEFEDYVENNPRIKDLVEKIGKEEQHMMQELMLNYYREISRIKPDYDFPDDLDLRDLFHIYSRISYGKVKKYN